MRVLNPLRNVSKLTIKVLMKHYGIQARIYEPAEIAKESINGHFDIEYRDEPTYEMKILFPSYFKYREYLNNSILDPFQENPDLFVWTDLQKPFKKFSKIIVGTNYTGVTTFKITDVVTESDDSGNFIHKHTLLPLYKNNEVHNFEAIRNDILDTTNITEIDKDLDTTLENYEAKKFGYNPIK